jgi:D-alanyl-D-alanine carboxypeptidase
LRITDAAPATSGRSLTSQRSQWRDILLRIVAAALLAAAPACGHQAPPVQSPAEVTGSSSRAAQEFDPATVGRLDGAINDAMRSASIPGAIIGVWGPQGRYVRAVGVADKTTGAAMNPDFYSRIGSETKTFTGNRGAAAC